jgi:glycosyltransferase involved in cell wall biosynthesis
MGNMRVLAFCSYPEESAATRYRLLQFVLPLANRGIDVTVKPFLNSEKYGNFYKKGRLIRNSLNLLGPLVQRTFDSLSAKDHDLLFVQREAMMFGPPIFEWIARAVGNIPMVLDLDDATYVSYVSPTYGKLGSAFKFFGKTDKLIEQSEFVIACNRFVAEYVEKKGKQTTIVPTVVDTDKFCPVSKDSEHIPVIGWIGSHSTLPLLESLFPILTRLALEHPFKLKVVGGGKEDIKIEGVELENLPWSLEREVDDLRSFDIGLYPMVVSDSASRDWLFGKSCFKAVQYMTAGIPFVLSPMGNCAETGIANETHFFANSDEQWYQSLQTLLNFPDLRKKMGERGRKFALENFTIEQQVDKIEEVFRQSIETFRRRRS